MYGEQQSRSFLLRHVAAKRRLSVAIVACEEANPCLMQFQLHLEVEDA
jgi:hypothetical protein